jgi:hypothetical protein
MNERIGVMPGTEVKLEREPKVIYVGRLEDLGLGNPNGIPSSLAEAGAPELNEYGELLTQCLSEITDNEHHACIDGRCVECNADNSAPEVRGRQVSGTGSVVNEAYMADADIIKTIPGDTTIGQEIGIVEAYLYDTIGLRPSAHEGGCGGVNGAIEDKETIANDPAIMDAVEEVMSVPEIQQFTGVEFNEKFSQPIKDRARERAQKLEMFDWSGQKYVEGVKERHPEGVEILETADDEFHGHAEKAVVFVLSKDRSIDETKLKEHGLGDVFVIGVQQSLDKAHAFGDSRGDEGVQQALMANMAKHMAVAKRLPSTKTPVYILVDF